MISEASDEAFKRWLDVLEFTTPALMANPHYAAIKRARGDEEELRELRLEWRERQERARARKLKEDASFAD